jgi:nitrogen fixation/metabolism regulation signal transduction histidine kinase
MICIVLVLLATGLVAVQGFHRIGSIIVARLTASSRMMAAADQVLSDLEEQERMLDRILVADDVLPDTKALEAGMAAMQERADSRSLKNTLSGALDEQAMTRIKAAWKKYRQCLGAVLKKRSGDAEKVHLQREDFLEASAALRHLRRTILDLLINKREQTTATEDTLRRVAFYFGLVIVLLTSLGMLVALGFHYRLTGLMIRPLERMIRFVENVGTGIFDERLGMQRDPLVNRLAQSCNRLTTNLQDAAEESWRRVRVERDIASTLIETFSQPTLVVTEGGDMLLSNAAARELFAGNDGKDRLEGLRRAIRTKTASFSDHGRDYRVRILGGGEGPRNLCFSVQVIPASELPAGEPEAAQA